MSRRKQPALGYCHRSAAVKRTATSWDDETFQQIRKLAVRAGISFSAQTRELVEIGLETIIAAANQERLARAADTRLQKR